MNKDVIPVTLKGLIPTNIGVAVILGNDDKIISIYVDPSVGAAIGMFLNNTEKQRPLTHDLIALILESLGARIERVVINDLKSGTYFGRIILSVENELHQKKIIEIDARPSDCIALATQQKAPILVSRVVWEEVEDMSEILEKLAEESLQSSGEDGGEDEDDGGSDTQKTE